MTKLNRPIRIRFANLCEPTCKFMERAQYIVCLCTGLFLAACASQPTGAPGSAAGADEQSSRASKDVIDATGLAAYYPFNGSARDQSSNGNHGTVHGGNFIADRLGRPSGAYALNGVDNYISVAGSKSLEAEFELSIAVWLYHKTQKSDKEWYSIVEKSDPERWGHSKYGMWLIRDLVEFCIQPIDLSLPHRCLDSETTLQPEQWHHLVGVNDGRVLRLYINGQPAGEKAFDSRTDTSRSDFELYIGTDLYDASPVYAKGAVDELRVYMRALSPSEVVTLFQSEHR